jgi:hypothetical protein
MNHQNHLKTLILVFSALVIGLSSCNQTTNYRIEEAQLSQEKQTETIKGIIRYLGKMPDKATPSSRTSEIFDTHYEKELKKYKLTHYYLDKQNNRQYFVCIRRAPSIKEKFVATAGYFVLEDNTIVDYEESFRTWKMEMDELLPKVDLLFGKYLKGYDLSMYYPENSGDEDYIEFPNSESFYVKEERAWKSTRENVMEEYHQQLRDLQ